ncbi:hypothetical protein [Pseudomonas aeruginosa]|uniref:hypothetical protein n=1 Tax=Pseudomonas aeruginosa TaxID=287 RepID=UPI00287D7BE5|nr:hypothetical protein [Pseudomonas aeruginosa]MDS9411548.1 hypothetical protein [Pseudomonas aeruginosa]MDS9424877.1 hypothetical protein [Pseudomonas aeruginosa]MDS9459068.1 hypothetical protein [Pseudomonas aeruginosa]MDS9493918.1 hypothetical protein [Pseudomonas aeruginosa]MDS9754328.1 hypothetical protein [Pseudomonas aeruginosa]
MKLNSARQAWHDAFHESRDSVLAVAAEKAMLGKRGRVVNETHPSRRDTNGRSAHMLAAGLVQAAIKTLPKPLQHFGHTLYSPLATGQDLNIAHALVWFTVELPTCSAKRREVSYWMALAAVRSHQAAVYGREPWSQGQICEFVRDWFGTAPSVAHWARDWAVIWNSLAATVDSLDAKALRPVAEVVRRASGADLRLRAGWRWVEVDRRRVLEQRAAGYLAKREAMQARLRSRLEAMDEPMLLTWFERMRRYSQAYREEWGEDTFLRKEAHAMYWDRIDAYWSQRQRLKKLKKQAA